MPKDTISGGTAHTLPADLRAALLRKPAARAAWEDITPLARNEWICWVTAVKKQETRDEHVTRAIAQLAEGKRRPCCWIGCVHRKDKPPSAAQRYIQARSTRDGAS